MGASFINKKILGLCIATILLTCTMNNSINGMEKEPVPKPVSFEKNTAENKIDIRKYIYIFRHGETNFNVEKRMSGHFEDLPIFLTENGSKQIKHLAKTIKNAGIEAIFTSDLTRAQDTAFIINEELNVPIFLHEELRGLSVGKYEGISHKEFLEKEEVIEAFKNYDKPTPGGESVNQFVKRLMSFITKIIIETPYKNIAIVAHGAVVSNLKAAISGNSYTDINTCVLSYENDTFKVVKYGVYTDFIV